MLASWRIAQHTTSGWISGLVIVLPLSLILLKRHPKRSPEYYISCYTCPRSKLNVCISQHPATASAALDCSLEMSYRLKTSRPLLGFCRLGCPESSEEAAARQLQSACRLHAVWDTLQKCARMQVGFWAQATSGQKFKWAFIGSEALFAANHLGLLPMLLEGASPHAFSPLRTLGMQHVPEFWCGKGSWVSALLPSVTKLCAWGQGHDVTVPSCAWQSQSLFWSMVHDCMEVQPSDLRIAYAQAASCSSLQSDIS